MTHSSASRARGCGHDYVGKTQCFIVFQKQNQHFFQYAVRFDNNHAVCLVLANTGEWGGDLIRDAWLMAGVLAVASLTTSLGAFTTVVEDRVFAITKGLYASPVKRSHITAGYIISPFIVSLLMTGVTAVGFSIFVVANGGQLPGFVGMLQLVGVMLVSGISATAIVCFIVSFIKATSTLGTVRTIIGTLCGFLMGIYLPIGILPAPIQTTIMLFPPSHAALLFRQILLVYPLEATFYGAPAGYAEALKAELGITFSFGSFEITPLMSIAYLLICAAVFFGLAAFSMRKAGKWGT